MSKVPLHEFERAKKIQKVVANFGKFVLIPLSGLVVLYVFVSMWVAGWGFIPIVITLAATIITVGTLYEKYVWIPLERAEKKGIIDE